MSAYLLCLARASAMSSGPLQSERRPMRIGCKSSVKVGYIEKRVVLLHKHEQMCKT